MTPYLEALIARLDADRLAVDHPSDEAYDRLADASAKLREEQDRLDPDDVRALLAHCHAVRRTEALRAACEDIARTLSSATRDAYRQHERARLDETAALWHWRGRVVR